MIEPSLTAAMRHALVTYQPKKLSLDRPKAAVLVPIHTDPEPSVLLTVRASHLNSHPGQVSFPGGMMEPIDPNLAHTALRETEEEVGLSPSGIDVIGELSTAYSKDGVLVYPFVGIVSDPYQSVASPDEIAEIFHVPWQFFASQAPELQAIDRHGMSFHIPHFHYEGHHIWGMTAMILLELINLIEGTDWPTPDFTLATRPGETP
ncbi:CoA pyrophosphatase [Reinekea blandensis]|uniref:MutT/nudix family protein n=1 Tax=Reinekea blandensis MED297 TaxID=314283 RepID=A4BH67_9GAMM|nr:CoA pyrophosphatase [Reinekea blandensis]EAR08566.1 mutT/nudix family protein [Reinekea sp. MED297] [Reinekea blandensis MED297]